MWPFNRIKCWLLIPSLWLFFFRCVFIYCISLRDPQSEESRPGKYRTCFTPFDHNVLFLQTSTVNPLYTNEMPSETTQISSIKLSRANGCLRLWNEESINVLRAFYVLVISEIFPDDVSRDVRRNVCLFAVRPLEAAASSIIFIEFSRFENLVSLSSKLRSDDLLTLLSSPVFSKIVRSSVVSSVCLSVKKNWPWLKWRFCIRNALFIPNAFS